MFYACIQKFDVTGTVQTFFLHFLPTKQALSLTRRSVFSFHSAQIVRSHFICMFVARIYHIACV
jgi:hypothetical protein